MTNIPTQEKKEDILIKVVKESIKDIRKVRREMRKKYPKVYEKNEV